MKQIILLLNLFLCLHANIAGQTLLSKRDAFNKDCTITKSGYTYQCDVVEKTAFVTLFNKNNKWVYEQNVFKDTGEYYDMETGHRPVSVIENPTMESKSFKIVDEAFSEEVAKQFGEQYLGISLYLDPMTGKVNEVVFSFMTFSLYPRIPISVYRDIELKLKKEISLVPTEIGKKLNYILVSWSQKPKGKLTLINKRPTLSIDD